MSWISRENCVKSLLPRTRLPPQGHSCHGYGSKVGQRCLWSCTGAHARAAILAGAPLARSASTRSFRLHTFPDPFLPWNCFHLFDLGIMDPHAHTPGCPPPQSREHDGRQPEKARQQRTPDDPYSHSRFAEPASQHCPIDIHHSACARYLPRVRRRRVCGGSSSGQGGFWGASRRNRRKSTPIPPRTSVRAP